MAVAKKKTTKTLRILSDRLKRWRQKGEWSQPAFARRAKLSVSYVSMLERGRREPSFAVLEKLARVFKVTPAELITEGATGTETPAATVEVK